MATLLTRNPTTYRTLLGVFDTVDEATQTVSDVIAAGIVPGAMEMMDKMIVNAVEDAFHFGFPRDAEAVLIIELDGLEAGIDRLAARCTDICKKNRAREVRTANTEEQRLAPGALGPFAYVPLLGDLVKMPTATDERFAPLQQAAYFAHDPVRHIVELYDPDGALTLFSTETLTLVG